MTDEHLLEEEVERDDAVIAQAFKWSVLVIVIIATGVGATLWFTRADDKEEVTGDGQTVLPNLDTDVEMELPSIPIVDATESSGVNFVHYRGATPEKLLPETMGGGVAVIDIDSDGLDDLVFVNSTTWEWAQSEGNLAGSRATLSAWRNKGNLEFEDVTEQVGLRLPVYGMGAASGDFDNDGDADLYISAVGKNLLFRNENGKFVDISDWSGTSGDPAAWSSSCGWLDYDNDGDLDLFVCNYVTWDRETDVAQDSNFAGDEKGYGRPDQFDGAFPYLFRNDGDGKFRDVSQDAGIQITNTTTGVAVAKSLGVAFADFNADGFLDVVVANDTVRNFLFQNTGQGGFEEVGSKAGIAFGRDGEARGAMGIDIAWFRNSKALGVAIGNFANEMTALYVSNGAMFFTDEAYANGLGAKTRLDLTFGVAWGDFDLDGRLDLFAANGHLEENINKVQASQNYAQPPQLFWNCGADQATEFEPLSEKECGPDFFKPVVGRGAVVADFDQDGDLDIVIVGSGTAARILRNNLARDSRNWVQFKLEGVSCNRSAIGAVIEVTAGGKTQRRMISSARGYLTSASLTATFGIGKHKQCQAKIMWPDGSTQEVEVDEINSLYTIVQSADETTKP